MFKKMLVVSAALFYSAVTLVAAPPVQSHPEQVPDSVAFQAVFKNLDQNGLSLKYGNANFIRETFSQIILTVLDQPGCKNNADIQLAAKIAGSLWNDSGLNGVQSLGNSLRRDGDGYLYRQFAYVPQQFRQGFLWDLCPDSSSLPMLELMPQNASFAMASNLDGAVLWKVIDGNVKKFAFAAQKQSYENVLADYRKGGFDVDKILSSIDGVAFYCVCNFAWLQNPGKAGGMPFSGALIFSVKNSNLFDQLLVQFKKQSPELVKNDEISLSVPVGTVTIFQQGKYLIASVDPSIKERLKSPTAPRLAANKDFIAASNGLPAHGNGWAYVAPNFVSQAATFGALMIPPESGVDLLPFIKLSGLDKSTFCVSGYTPEGVFSYTRTGSRALAILLGYPEAGSMIGSAFTSAVSSACSAALSTMNDMLGGDDDDAD